MRLLIVCVASAVAVSVEARAFDLCGSIDEDRPSDLQIGRIVGNGPAFFSASLTPCDPQEEACKAYGHPFVSPAATVAISGAADGHLCVEAPVPDGKKRLFGWLPADRVVVLPTNGARPLGWWAASWRAPDRRIDLWIDKGELKSEAGALWRGRLSPRFGEFRGAMQLLPDGVLYSNGCEVKLMGLREQVVAIDNGHCGALNVSFSGFYVRHRLGEK